MTRLPIFVSAAALTSVLAVLPAPARGQWLLNGSSVYYNAGNVGLGTASPAFPLDMVKSQAVARLTSTISGSGSVLALRHTGLVGPYTTYGAVNFDSSSSTLGQISYLGSNAMAFRVNSGERMRITNDGDVGIGLINPVARLDVTVDSDQPAVQGTNSASAHADTATGVRGVLLSPIPGPHSAAVRGINNCTESANGYGVWGSHAGEGSGVYGTSPGGIGVLGVSDYGWGVFGRSTSSYAGLFDGDVYVTGVLLAHVKQFKIDHPLDPANKYLAHSCVESSEMMNVYSGVVVTDGLGYGTVALPDWFEALNKDFRYQLTIVDEGDQTQFNWARVVRKIADRQFTIRTTLPNTEVSWQVTGVRKDAYALAHPLVVEQDKQGVERGHYLTPEVFGHPRSMSVTEAIRPGITSPHGRTSSGER